jgi:hypothetical protein
MDGAVTGVTAVTSVHGRRTILGHVSVRGVHD